MSLTKSEHLIALVELAEDHTARAVAILVSDSPTPAAVQRALVEATLASAARLEVIGLMLAELADTASRRL